MAQQSTKSGVKVTLDPVVRDQVKAFASELSATPSMSDYRKQVLSEVVALENVEAANSGLLVTEIKRVLGAMNKIPKVHDPEEKGLKGRALDLAALAMKAHAAPTKQSATPVQLRLNDEIVERSKLDTKGFMSWLQSELGSSNAKNWNAVNLSTACYHLNKFHGGGAQAGHRRPWSTMGRDAFQTAKLLAEALTARSKVESCTGQTVLNIGKTVPHIVTALSLVRGEAGDLDARFLTALASLVRGSHEPFERSYINDMVLHPLSETKSYYLSPKGAAALCEYAAAVHARISSEVTTEAIHAIGDRIRSLRGISSWCDSAENQEHLASILKPINRRIEEGLGRIDSTAVVTILGGLRGVEFSRLADPALSEVATTLRLVNAKLSDMPGALTYQAVGAASHSLGVATDVRSGPLQRVTSRLLTTMAEKLPVAGPRSFSDLGTLCSALYTLHPVSNAESHPEYQPLMNGLKQLMRNADLRNLEVNGDHRELETAWSVIHQTYAVYGVKLPAALESILRNVGDGLNRAGAKTVSAGERVALSVLACAPDVRAVPGARYNGFELDIAVKGSSAERRVNIEIDGPHHQEPTQRRSDLIRDAFLRQKNIEVIRISGAITEARVAEVVENKGIRINRDKLAEAGSDLVSAKRR